MEFKTAYGPKDRVSLDCGRGMTKQEFKKQCDINTIMLKHQKTGVINHFNRYEGDYKDLSAPVSFHEAMNIVIRAEDAFNSLPSTVRKKFSNDPQEFLDFVSDPSNIEEMRELGLASPSLDVVPDAPVVPSEPVAPTE